jgi:hypothetical protein
MFAVYNTHTESPVTHGEAWVTVCWENKRQAFDYAMSLTLEYRLKYQDTPENRKKFHWAVREATPEEIQKAIAAGIIGPEWEGTLFRGSAQLSPKAVNFSPDEQLGRPEGWTPDD